MAPLGVAAILAAAVTDAEQLGLFERAQAHEFIDAPGNGLSVAMWLDKAMPIPAMSGLNSTSYLVLVTVRLYMDMLHQPADDIDAKVMGGVDGLFAAYTGGFTLGGLVEQVDLFGAYGDPLSVTFKYATQNQKLYRIATIALPLVAIDLYGQAS